MAIRRHTELKVYERAFAAAMSIFDATKSFPKEERYSLVDGSTVVGLCVQILPKRGESDDTKRHLSAS